MNHSKCGLADISLEVRKFSNSRVAQIETGTLFKLHMRWTTQPTRPREMPRPGSNVSSVSPAVRANYEEVGPVLPRKHDFTRSESENWRCSRDDQNGEDKGWVSGGQFPKSKVPNRLITIRRDRRVTFWHDLLPRHREGGRVAGTPGSAAAGPSATAAAPLPVRCQGGRARLPPAAVGQREPGG